MRSNWLLGSALCLAIGSLPLAFGCSSSPQPANNTTSDAGDGGAQEAAADGGGSDAPPDSDQDPDVYPADHMPIPQIDWNGGPVLAHPRIVTVTFTGDTHRDALRGFDHKITATGWWHEAIAGYCAPPDGGTCVGDGTATAGDGGFWHPDGSTADAGDGYVDVELAYDFPSNNISDQDIGGWLVNHVKAGDFPARDDQTLYALYFPSGVNIDLYGSASCVNFGAYHSNTTDGSNVYVYAVMPFCSSGGGPKSDFDFLTLSASHEFAEAASDPQVNRSTAYYLNSNDAWKGVLSYGQAGENGDMCTGAVPEGYNESGWNVQRIWSNLAAAKSENPCQPAVKPAYFGAAVRTDKTHVSWGGQDYYSYGYVVASKGQSVDVMADVFSEKALPHDLLLYAGKDKGAGHDPSDMATPDNGVTVDLSRNQVHNGNVVTLSIHVAGNALPNKDSAFVVRAVLETDDYNDWPVIVHVK